MSLGYDQSVVCCLLILSVKVYLLCETVTCVLRSNHVELVIMLGEISIWKCTCFQSGHKVRGLL